MLKGSLSILTRARGALAAATIAMLGSVAVMATASAALCVNGATLADYISAGSCNIGDKVFDQFSYTFAATDGVIPIPESGITVETIGPSGSGATLPGPDIGLQFAAPWTAGPQEILNSYIRFRVTSTGALIEDATLVQSDSRAFGTGAAAVGEDLFPDSTLGIPVASLFTFHTEALSQLTDHVVFTPRSSVYVVTVISVSGGTDGVAAISLVQNTFSQQVPEPASLALLGGGLLGMALFRRRRKAA